MRTWPGFIVIAALVIAPILLRPDQEAAAAHASVAEEIVILSPHEESTRSEFQRAFTAYAWRVLHRRIDIDWRSPGGSTEITNFIKDRFRGAAQDALTPTYGSLARSFADPDPGPEAKAVRAAFLSSDIGIGVDLLWGGGELMHRRLAEAGYLVDAGLIRSHPRWFDPAVMPQRLSGEIIYDPQGRYYGACLSSFGICSSPDRIAALGLTRPPQSWADLADPRLLGTVCMADPTQSGSIVACLERLLQERMADAVAAQGAGPSEQALDSGWASGFTLIKEITGNARSVADGANLVVLDVARGDASAAMCIDFFARSEGAWTAAAGRGPPRIVFRVPKGGTSISADPIALLRGAPHRDLAVAFMTFVLSREGQRLWDYRVGEPGGPQTFALHRWPVRHDVYTALDLRRMSDPDEDPFALAASFHYHPAWTGPLFSMIPMLTQAVALAPRAELTAAWRAIIAAGGPRRVPEAMAAFAWLPFPRHEAQAILAGFTHHPRLRLSMVRGWVIAAQEHYRRAAALARDGR